MSQDNQHEAPDEVAGGYGTPTVEQETGGDAKQFAQPREEEDFDAAGLNQESPDGQTFETGTPNLSHFAEEDQDSAGQPGAGRFGGTDEQLHAEGDSSGAGFGQGSGGSPIPRDPGAPPGAEQDDVAVPSADAEIDEGNADEPRSGQFSSEPGQEAAGVPDGSGNDLPKEKSPNDDDETFDAG
jgi:hypothetical protein